MECRKKIIPWLVLAGVVLASIAEAQTNAPVRPAVAASGLRLAQELSGEGQHAAAALEYRRLALGETEAQARGGLFWAAAYEYTRARQWDLAGSLLDRAEDSDRELAPAALLLRAEAASAGKKHTEAVYYLQSAVGEDTASDMRKFVARRTAGEYLRAGRNDQARAVLSRSPGDETAALAALARYERERDKSPVLGGVLGLIPGLGYMYSGEYANGLRSLILNGLFMGAMVYSGVEDQWGAFAVIAFFEITWYSGSIYGGIDAAQRYNRARQERCLDAVQGPAVFTPDFQRLPVVSLQFRF
jgi:tetratricopeptide (TPR) repeat protein